MSDVTATSFAARQPRRIPVGERLMDRIANGRWRAWIDSLDRREVRVEMDRKSGRTVLRLGGHLDTQSALVLKRAVQAVLPIAPKSVEIDLAEVDRVDGSGLAALVWAWHLGRQCGCGIRVVRLAPEVREIVARMNLHHLLEIVDEQASLVLAC